MFDASVTEDEPPGLGPVGRLDLPGGPTYTFSYAPHIASKTICDRLFADMMFDLAMGPEGDAEDLSAELRSVGRLQLLDLAGTVDELPRALDDLLCGRPPQAVTPAEARATIGRYRQTLLHFALLLDSREAARALVAAGAPLAHEDAYGLTPALLAALKGVDLEAELGLPAAQAAEARAHRSATLDLSGAEAAGLPRAPTWELGPLRLYDPAAGRVEELPPARVEELLSRSAGFPVRLTSRPVVTRSYIRHLALNALRPLAHNALHPPGLLERLRAVGQDARGLALAHISPAVGFGLFALRPFAAGEPLCGYGGEAKERAAGRASDLYTFRTLVPAVVLDAAAARGLGALVNHSRAPNAEAVSWFEGGVPRLALVAARDIAPGEQLLLDYTGGGSAPEEEAGVRAFAPGSAPLDLAAGGGWPARIPPEHLPPWRD